MKKLSRFSKIEDIESIKIGDSVSFEKAVADIITTIEVQERGTEKHYYFGFKKAKTILIIK